MVLHDAISHGMIQYQNWRLTIQSVTKVAQWNHVQMRRGGGGGGGGGGGILGQSRRAQERSCEHRISPVLAGRSTKELRGAGSY